MKTTLIIVFNRFYPDKGMSYLEIAETASGSCSERTLKREPKAARFDEVWETGEGSYNQWNANKAQRIYGHPLERKEP